MKNIRKKMVKILLLIAVIISDLATPIKVFADEISSNNPSKGDLRLGTTISNSSVSTSVGDSTVEGGVSVTKTVTKVNDTGKYRVDFEIKGKDVKTTTQVQKPVYAVVVFDKSGSMENTCTKTERQWVSNGRYGYWDDVCVETDEKWDSAVDGAKLFATTLLGRITNAQIALVTFSGNKNDGAYNDATAVRGFANANLDNEDFGSPYGGTNLHAGLLEAQTLLDAITDEDAYKYVVVISDGQPTFYYDNNGYTNGDGNSTNKNTYDNTINAATSLKSKTGTNAEVFSIGYMLPSGNVYGNKSAADILTEVSSSSDHYFDSAPAAVADAFNNIANNISTANAATDAVLTDTIGGEFTVVNTTSDDGKFENENGKMKFVSNNIPNITEDGTKISFEIQIDEEASTGWHKTNDGFNLVYTDAKSESKTLIGTEDPEVYWVQPEYNYTINYYKDSIDSSNFIDKVEGTAVKGATVSADTTKFLPTGYEFNKAVPSTSITIKKDDSNVIDVLYTIKKFSYKVNYIYDENDLDKTINKDNVSYGTAVTTEEYINLNASNVREGYVLDTTRTTLTNYTINENGTVINIYYKKNTYGYTVNYYFNSETGFSKSNNALYNTTIKAQDNYLTQTELNEKNRSDYFIDPTKAENTSSITIGTGDNILNIYYINTYINNETITKNSNITKISSTNTLVDYKIVYSSVVNNVRKGDVITVTVVDTLPYEIDTTKSVLAGGTYDSTNKTITWTKTITASADYEKNKVLSQEINISLLYKDFATLSAADNNNLVNTVTGTTMVNKISTNGATASEEIPVEIKGNVIAKYVDEDNSELAKSETQSNLLVGTTYNTEAKDIFGYTLKETPKNKSGVVTEKDITVTYVYTKNEGIIENPSTDKTGPRAMSDVNGVFDYNIKAEATIKEYVGDATLTVVDTLPYAIDEEKSVLDNRCIYDAESNTITCTDQYNDLTEENYTNGVFKVDETFNLKLVFIDVDSNRVINTAESTIDLNGNYETTDDETETEVYSGAVVATYETEDGEVLSDPVSTTGLAGTEYTTEQKEFDGYELKEVPENKDGEYLANQEILVKYIYKKNLGNGDFEELPPQTGLEVNVFEYISYLLMALVLAKMAKNLKNN